MSCAHEPVIRSVHLRGAYLHNDIAVAGRELYRPLTLAEVSEITAAVVKTLVDDNRSQIYLSETEFISLCRNHSHS